MGTTNKILCVSYRAAANWTSYEERLLFRIYGSNTSKIIDRQKEFDNWRYLASCGCAAQLYARFTNGIVSGFIPGNTLTVSNVRDKLIITKICKTLAKMHKLKPNTGSALQPVLFAKISQYLEVSSGHYQVSFVFTKKFLQTLKKAHSG
ncbi:unnamed protein product [Gongylonema pulchrum]|uniref:ethanolamine kinase n=1 Tax=Gongylonema pulchrum TaxID=637853 RepID=A0A183DF73_9BILA|nr:unnamed protein product [Gongylonema pulchrum]